MAFDISRFAQTGQAPSTERSIGDITTEILRLKQDAGNAILGIGQRLIEAKAMLPHGEWLPWLTEQVEVSERTAPHFLHLKKFRPPKPITLRTSPLQNGHGSSTPASVRRLAASWSPSRARVLSSIVRFLLYQRPLRNAILACGDLLFDGRLFRALHAAIGFFDKPKCFPILISLMPFWYSCIHVASSNTAFGLPFGFGGVR